MRCVGLDIAKTGYSGCSLAIDGTPSRSAVWKPANPKDTSSNILAQYEEWLRRQLWIMKPDIISVEELQVFQNKKVIRALSHHEGVALLTAKKYGRCFVVNPSPSTVRKIVLGNGGLSKENAFVAFKKKFPDFKLLPKTSGGFDQMDSMTQALAAPVVLERR